MVHEHIGVAVNFQLHVGSYTEGTYFFISLIICLKTVAANGWPRGCLAPKHLAGD